MTVALRLAVDVFAAFATASGLSRAARSSQRRRFGSQVFILEYHGVSADNVESEGIVSKARFRRHLRFLKRQYRLVTRAQVSRFLNGECTSVDDLILVTFDDGYRDNYLNAWPVLREEDVPAIVFVTTGYLDGAPLWFDIARQALENGAKLPDAIPAQLAAKLTTGGIDLRQTLSVEKTLNQLKSLSESDRSQIVESLIKDSPLPVVRSPPLTWQQVLEMQRGGIEIGGHTVTHPILSKLTNDRQKEEIFGCRSRILEMTGTAPAAFAFPNGSASDFNAESLSLLKSSGFSTAMTTIRGANRPGCDPYTLRRIGIGSDSRWLLSARLSGLFNEEVRRRFRRLGRLGPT